MSDAPVSTRLLNANVARVALAGLAVIAVAVAVTVPHDDTPARGTAVVLVDSTTSTVAPSTTTTAPSLSGPLRTPTATQPLRAWAGGDSLAAGPTWALGELLRTTGVVAPHIEFHVGTGLVNQSFFPWTEHLADVVAEQRPEVMFFMSGANDNQPIEGHQPGSPEWLAAYRSRVGAVMDVAKPIGARLLWAGMPPMKDPAFSGRMGVVNDVLRSEAASRSWVTYVDLWPTFSTPGSPGTFQAKLPGIDGDLKTLRADDGVHMNVSGSRVVAREWMKALVPLVTLPTPADGTPVAPFADPTDDPAIPAEVQQACHLFTRDEIQFAFGGPVGPPTPLRPYCRWTVGDKAWVALWVFPGKTWDDVAKRFKSIKVVGAKGPTPGAFFATNKQLYFGVDGVGYSLQWQDSGTWDDEHRDELVALAGVLANR
jgi:uncharacterized protein